MNPHKKYGLPATMRWMLNGFSVGMLCFGAMKILFNWSPIHKSESMESLALLLIGAVVWAAFTFIEKSPENINLPIFLHADQAKNIEYNRMVVNVLKNAVAVGLVLFSLAIR